MTSVFGSEGVDTMVRNQAREVARCLGEPLRNRRRSSVVPTVKLR